jgi:release factor glutamine methyltransferase
LKDTASKKLNILELCTGSGCISLALAKHLPKNTVQVTGLDIASTAITLAKDNLHKHRHVIQNDVQFLQHDLFHPDMSTVVPSYNLIVANPPYVTNKEYDSLDPDVKDWEDELALVADESGTSILKRIIKLSTFCNPVSKSVPYLFMEFGGSHQVPALKDTMVHHGFSQISVWKDLAEKDRVITGY